MKKLLLLVLAVGFAVFPSTALAENDDNEVCETSQQEECQSPREECEGQCPVYIGILPTTTTTAALPTTTTTAALPTTTTTVEEVKGQVITQTPPPSDPGVLPITGGDVLGLTAIGVALAAIGFGLTRARRSEA